MEQFDKDTFNQNLVIDDSDININNSNNNESQPKSVSYHAEAQNENYINDYPILIDMGFEEKIIKKVYIFLRPNNIEQAILYMTEEKGIYQHDFYSATNSTTQKCFICGKPRILHINYSNHFNNDNDNNDDDLFLSSHIASNNQLHDVTPGEPNNNNNIINQQQQHNQPTTTTCIICYSPLTSIELTNYSLSCGHVCCSVCWFEYLKTKIISANVSKIKCASYKCNVILHEQFIMNIINTDNKLITKYNEYKRKASILAHPNRKFCPHPNCDSYLEKSNNKYVSCEHDHKYCYICLKPWHGDIKCDEELDKDFQLWKKNKVVKRCPQCQFYTEKNEGCNHMTCVECKFQWCWLCEGEYNAEHYNVGKCKGLQFYSEGRRRRRNNNEVPLEQPPKCCSKYLFYPSFDGCEDDYLDGCFFNVDIANICNRIKCLHYLFLFIFCFFGIVPTMTIMLYMEFTYDSTKVRKYRKFLNVMTLLFAIVNFVFLQIGATCLSVGYCVVTVFYPPVNTFRIMYLVAEDKLQ